VGRVRRPPGVRTASKRTPDETHLQAQCRASRDLGFRSPPISRATSGAGEDAYRERLGAHLRWRSQTGVDRDERPSLQQAPARLSDQVSANPRCGIARASYASGDKRPPDRDGRDIASGLGLGGARRCRTLRTHRLVALRPAPTRCPLSARGARSQPEFATASANPTYHLASCRSNDPYRSRLC